MPRTFRKVLVANRGEIAVRVMRTLREMGIVSVAVYSDADRAALHVRSADEAYPIGPAPAGESYLRVDKIIDTAKKNGCDGIHPGYGFLSENPALPEACERAGIAFIGPPASSMRAMGSKTAARDKMSAAGVPIVPGARCETTDEAVAAAKKIGFPVMLKATAGGGGIGMRVCEDAAALAESYPLVTRLAGSSFSDARVYVERYVHDARHVEVQIFGDGAGRVVALGERDCSLQRRNQKVMEETPAPGLPAQATRAPSWPKRQTASTS